MSIEATDLVWKHSKQKGASLLIMLAIANYVNKDGQAWPKIQTLADMANIDRRYTRRIINKLVECGELCIEENVGRGHTNVYRINLKGGNEYPHLETEKGVMSTPIKKIKGGNLLQKGGNLLQEKGVMSTPQNHIKEPLKNHSSNGRGPDDFSLAVSAYENNIGTLTPMLSEMLGDAVDEFGSQWVIEAIAIALENNVRKWKYIQAILDRWGTEGRGAKDKTIKKTEDGGVYV